MIKTLEYSLLTEEEKPENIGTSLWLLAETSDLTAKLQAEIFFKDAMPCNFNAWNKKLTYQRVCNGCDTQKTSKWYKDHHDLGKHICKKCYNYRYKERIKQ